MKLLALILTLVVATHFVVVTTTTWWTLSGHCCGMYIPFITDNADSCLPVQDKQFMTQLLSPDTHCDHYAWQRVRNAESMP